MRFTRSRRCVVFQPSFAWIVAALAVVLAAWTGPGSLSAGEPSVVFVSRKLNAQPVADRRTAPVESAQKGRLLALMPGQSLKALVDADDPQAPWGTPTDVMDPDVSYDATRIVFSGFVPLESAWRIFEIQVDAAGNASGLKQITQSDRQIDLTRFGEAAARLQSYDDADPCYLPDGRICFVSTRYPGIAPDGRVRTTNLFVMNADGSDLHRITTERFAADTPTVDPTSGKIVYSRWWRTAQSLDEKSGTVPDPIPPGSPGYGNVDPNSGNGSVPGGFAPQVLRGVNPSQFPGVNSWFLASISPDGTGLQMHSGFRIDREQTQAYRPSFFPNGDAAALFIPQTPFLGFPGPNGLRRYTPGASRPIGLGGPQTFGQNTKPVPGQADEAVPPLPPFFNIFFQSAVPLSDGRILVSASVNGSPFGLYFHDGSQSGMPALFHQNSDYAELDAVPLATRPVPTVLHDILAARMKDDIPSTVADAKRENGTFTFRCDNVHFNGPVDMPIATAPPVGKKLTIEFYMVPQRTGVAAADPPILIDSKQIGPNGKVEAELPGGVPLFELLRRPDDSIGLGRDGQIFHVGGMNFGEAAQQGSCVGCHAGHSMLVAPADATWTNLAPSALVGDGSSPTPGADGNVDQVRDQPFASTFPQHLVDRSTEPFVSEWRASTVQAKHELSFRWSVPIRAKEAIVYGAQPRGGGFEQEQVTITKAFTVSTFLGATPQQSTPKMAEAVPSGRHVPLDSNLEFDRFVITIEASDLETPPGSFPAPVLAEVEVIAHAIASEPTISFVRGDANCDSHSNLSDAVTILGGLFLGQSVCCAAAADSNADDHVNITDAIDLLRNLFAGADPLPFPNETQGNCNRVPEQTLVCDQESCF